MLPAVVRVDETTRVAEVRRLAVASAEAEGLPRPASEQVAIIATEIATNLLKHASAGEVHISRLAATGQPGVEILSIDRGPGMVSLPDCTADGFSTTGTPGTGLGAIARLTDLFDAYSQPGRGTVLLARKFLNGVATAARAGWVFAAVQVPYPGEQTCGDNWDLSHTGSATSMIIADGLGHGVLAADASLAAIRAFRNGPSDSPASILENVHLALRSTRGAAVAVTRIEHDHGRVRFAGIGNIAGVLLGGPRPQYMVSHNGTAGFEARRFQEFDYALPPHATIVMHSDGLVTNWSLSAYPGLLRRHPAVIAGILYRDATRGRDDVCILVGRYIGN